MTTEPGASQSQDVPAASATGTPSVTLHHSVRMPVLGLGVFQVSDQQAAQAVGTALAAGYRHVDTAAAYGNEAGVGRGIAASGLPREDVFVTTKLWNDDQGYERTLAAAKRSLQLLGLEYLDLYLIHWPCPARGLFVDSWRALERLQSDGLVRAIGVSNFEPDQLDRLAAECSVTPSVNQIELHPAHQRPDLRRELAERGIIAEAWSPLGQGSALANPIIGEIATAHDRSPAQVVLRWQLQLGNAVIPKSVTPARIRENLRIFDFTLDQAQLAAIASLNTDTGLGIAPPGID